MGADRLLVHSVQLEHVLGNVQSDARALHETALLSMAMSYHAAVPILPPGWVHSIRSLEALYNVGSYLHSKGKGFSNACGEAREATFN